MRYISKQFLSDDYDESGAIVCKAETVMYEDVGKHYAECPTIDASVIFRDCYGKPTELGFYVNSEKGLERRVAKLNLMIEELQKFRDALTPMYEQAKVDGEKWLREHPEEDGFTNTPT